MKKQILFPLIFGFISTLAIAQVPNDVYRMEAVSRPKISPEGSWILYSQSKIDAAKDRSVSKSLRTVLRNICKLFFMTT